MGVVFLCLSGTQSKSYYYYYAANQIQNSAKRNLINYGGACGESVLLRSQISVVFSARKQGPFRNAAPQKWWTNVGIKEDDDDSVGNIFKCTSAMELKYRGRRGGKYRCVVAKMLSPVALNQYTCVQAASELLHNFLLRLAP